MISKNNRIVFLFYFSDERKINCDKIIIERNVYKIFVRIYYFIIYVGILSVGVTILMSH